jgi:hypothetical protein
VNEKETMLTTIISAAVALVLIAAVFVLAWHGTVDGQAAIGFFSGVSLAGIAVGGHAVGVRTGAAAAKASPD